MRVRIVSLLAVAALIASTVVVEPQTSGGGRARNVILFLGDGVGLSSLNAASILGHGKPQSLYLQRMPHLALADTSSVAHWVTDAGAAATAMATGRKTVNRMVSAFPADSAVSAGVAAAQTILEHAEARGLSTGVISDSSLINPLVSAFYAHQASRDDYGEIFAQLLTPRAGDGVDVAIGPGRKAILQRIGARADTLVAEFAANKTVFSHDIRALDSRGDPRRVILLDDQEFDLAAVVEKTAAHLAQNPNGFFLAVHADCHLNEPEKSLRRVLALDRTVQRAVDRYGADTLILVTADHGYALQTRDASVPKTEKFLSQVFLVDEHSGEEVPVLATGPGAERVKGFVPNTKVFDWMMQAFGWSE